MAFCSKEPGRLDLPSGSLASILKSIGREVTVSGGKTGFVGTGTTALALTGLICDRLMFSLMVFELIEVEAFVTP